MEGAKAAGDLAASDEQCPSTLVAVHTSAKCGIAVTNTLLDQRGCCSSASVLEALTPSKPDRSVGAVLYSTIWSHALENDAQQSSVIMDLRKL